MDEEWVIQYFLFNGAASIINGDAQMRAGCGQNAQMRMSCFREAWNVRWSSDI